MNLNASQLAAVASTSTRILCTAAAGSGKTRTLAARIERMIVDGIDPASIVVVTFTNSAAAEISKRLALKERFADDELPSHALGFCGTLHSFILRLLQNHGNLIGLPSRLTVLDATEAEAMLVEAMAKLAYKGTRKAVDEQVSFGLSKWMHNMHTSGPPPATRLTDQERVAYEFYWQLMTTGCMTFDMLLDLGLALIKTLNNQDIGQYQNIRQYQHIAIDEAQDSSELDWQIYEALPVKTRFIIGDARQRVYSFRGSCDGFERMIAEAPGNGWTALELAENYRSGSNIIAAANRLMSNFPPMRSAVSPPYGNIRVNGYPTAAQEAAAIVYDITTMLWDPAGIYDEDQKVPANEIAVLCRTNALVDFYKKALTDSGVPVRAKKQIENPLDWRMARAFVAMLTNPENDRLTCKFLELKLGTDKARQMQVKATADFQTINETFLHIRHMQIQDVTTAAAQAGIGRESIWRIRSMIEQLPGATLLELQGALAEFDAEQNEEGDGVTVCTAHASKGREFQCVFIAAVEETIWPSKREIDEDGGAESRRLFYVAITRAKQLCAISYSRRRMVEWRGVCDMLPSRFVAEAVS